MGCYYGPPQRFLLGGRRGPWQDPNIRVSDAERADMSDVLSKHYADGRLDDAEFKSRLDRAMAAKTRGDLAGLLEDLPPLGTESPSPRRTGFGRVLWVTAMLAFFVVALSAASWVATPHVPWLVVILVVVFLANRHRHHHYHRHDAEGVWPARRAG